MLKYNIFGGKREGGSGWGTHVNPWLIHVNVWQKPLQYYKVISIQLIKINKKKKKKKIQHFTIPFILSFSAGRVLNKKLSAKAWASEQSNTIYLSAFKSPHICSFKTLSFVPCEISDHF